MIVRWIFCLTFMGGIIYKQVSGLRRFEIDYENDQFLMDGNPFRFISGSVHYFRVPRIYWADRLKKMRMAGLNTIQTYIEWNQHEPYQGLYNFKNELDVTGFIQLAQKMGLYVLLRPGPYICAEREMGGLPFWLLQKNPNIKLRSSDSDYLQFVDAWLDILLPKIKPLLYANGGPVLAVQVENEYGNYPLCDKKYMAHLRDNLWYHLGNDTVLYTTDAAHDKNIECGTVDGVYKTIDFEPTRNVSDAFSTMRRHQPRGPLVNSELYAGWLDHWSYPHTSTFSTTDIIINALDEILSMNASVNIYMFHGGTSFGFSNGANFDSNYMACPTSYDYNAPLSEAGDPTEKYFALRKLIQKYHQLPPGPVPKPCPKFGDLKVMMKPAGSLFDLIKYVQASIHFSDYPITFEEIGQAYGFLLYETVIDKQYMDPALLQIPGLRDRAMIFIDEKLSGILSRQENLFATGIRVKVGQKLSILVENQGRITFGPYINDSKGIIGNVTLGSATLVSWKITSLPFNNTWTFANKLSMLANKQNGNASCPKNNVPGIFIGEFYLKNVSDSFLSLPGWSKGVAFVNGKNLGRYWPAVGPQVTLYVPQSFLHSDLVRNVVMLFELEDAPCDVEHETLPNNSVKSDNCFVQFVRTPIINGSTPN